jgi:hypothetical protein
VILASLLRTALAAGIDPQVYCRDVLLRIGQETDVAKLTPHASKEIFAAEVQARRYERSDASVGGDRLNSFRDTAAPIAVADTTSLIDGRRSSCASSLRPRALLAAQHEDETAFLLHLVARHLHAAAARALVHHLLRNVGAQELSCDVRALGLPQFLEQQVGER